jgi:hypothetical protein
LDRTTVVTVVIVRRENRWWKESRFEKGGAGDGS